MGGRTMPDKCSHGAIRDWGDFGPEDGAPEFCKVCDAPPSRAEGDDGRSRAIEAMVDAGIDPNACYSEGRLHEMMTTALDEAIASGGVVDVMEHKKALEAEAAKTDEWKARVRELEAALGEIRCALEDHGA